MFEKSRRVDLQTKFMRYVPYEDSLINRTLGGCKGILEQLEQNPPPGILFQAPTSSSHITEYEGGCGLAVIDAFTDRDQYREIAFAREKFLHPLLPLHTFILRVYTLPNSQEPATK